MTLSEHHRRRLAAAAVAGYLLLAPGSSHAQDPPATVPPAAIAAAEAAAIAQYWVLIAERKFDEAALTVGSLAARYPRSVAVLTLLVETDIARGGATTALRSYETWLGSRTLEEPGVLRRLARAVLYEWARQTGDRGAGTDALVILAGEGERAAIDAIAAMRQSRTESGLRAAVRLGDPEAVEAVANRIRAGSGLKLRDLQLLAESASPKAIPVLTEVLGDPNAENRAAAADALGQIGGAEAENALRPMVADPHGVVRTSAAAALFKMGNFSGAAILNELAASEYASIRRTAAMLMASQPDEAWKALVRGLLTDPDPTIRLDAARMLAPYDPATADAMLDALSGDSNIAIREATALARAGLPTSNLTTLRSLMTTGTSTARVRAAGRILALTR